MTNEEELWRLTQGSSPTTRLSPNIIVRLVAICPGNASDVLSRCKQVLEIVLKQDVNDWPSVDVWRSILPEWFVRRSATEVSQEEAERRFRLPLEERIKLGKEWSVGAFVHWFQPSERFWFWWDSTVENADTLRVAVNVADLPFPWGALEWLLRASGATSIEEE